MRRKSNEMKWYRCSVCDGRIYEHRKSSHICKKKDIYRDVGRGIVYGTVALGLYKMIKK